MLQTGVYGGSCGPGKAWRQNSLFLACYFPDTPLLNPCSKSCLKMGRTAGEWRWMGVSMESGENQTLGNMDFPCIFPCYREFGLETGSLWTASATTQSAAIVPDR